MPNSQGTIHSVVWKPNLAAIDELKFAAPHLFPSFPHQKIQQELGEHKLMYYCSTVEINGVESFVAVVVGDPCLYLYTRTGIRKRILPVFAIQKIFRCQGDIVWLVPDDADMHFKLGVEQAKQCIAVTPKTPPCLDIAGNTS
eukprot:PhF_6_TR27027/c0_g1_i1/m.39475